jgi:hypothetical protein
VVQVQDVIPVTCLSSGLLDFMVYEHNSILRESCPHAQQAVFGTLAEQIESNLMPREQRQELQLVCGHIFLAYSQCIGCRCLCAGLTFAASGEWPFMTVHPSA